MRSPLLRARSTISLMLLNVGVGAGVSLGTFTGSSDVLGDVIGSTLVLFTGREAFFFYLVH